METLCELVRGPVYLTGEEVECSIQFTNRDDKGVVLAWGSAQLHCFCSVSDTKVANLEVKDKPASRKISLGSNAGVTATSFNPTEGESGLAVLSTKTRILFCSLELQPGETRQFFIREKIPANAPPSYRGHAVKYSYKLVVGSQRLGQPATLHRIPLRIMSVDCGTLIGADMDEKLGPSNPFLEEVTPKEAPVDIIMQSIQDVTSRRSASYYVIANAKGRVCKFCIYKKNYKLGEDVVGSFDFSVGTVSCLQYSVTLQQVENIEQGFRVKEDQPAKLTSHSKQHEVCLGLAHSHMVLPVPLQLSPSFATNVCSVQYQLHFEFVTSIHNMEKQNVVAEGGGSEWQGPCKVDIETMVWDLPIRLFPTFPSHTAPHSNMAASLRSIS